MLAHLTRLTSLTLDSPRPAASMADFAALSSLQRLHLMRWSFPTGAHELASLPGLTDLCVHGAYQLYRSHFAPMTALRRLVLHESCNTRPVQMQIPPRRVSLAWLSKCCVLESVCVRPLLPVESLRCAKSTCAPLSAVRPPCCGCCPFPAQHRAPLCVTAETRPCVQIKGPFAIMGLSELRASAATLRQVAIIAVLHDATTLDAVVASLPTSMPALQYLNLRLSPAWTDGLNVPDNVPFMDVVKCDLVWREAADTAAPALHGFEPWQGSDQWQRSAVSGWSVFCPDDPPAELPW